MKLLIELHGLPKWKQDFLDADYRYAQAMLKLEINNNIEKIKGNGIMGKALKVAGRMNSMANVSIERLLANLETLRDYDIFNYTIKNEKGTSVVKLEVNEEYFKIVEIARQSRLKIGYTKEGFIKETEKSLKETYGNVQITRLD
jgi:hypothetical protein